MRDALTDRLHALNMLKEPIVLDLRARINDLEAALERVSAIPVPEGYIVQMPCKACKKRVKIAQNALK